MKRKNDTHHSTHLEKLKNKDFFLFIHTRHRCYATSGTPCFSLPPTEDESSDEIDGVDSRTGPGAKGDKLLTPNDREFFLRRCWPCSAIDGLVISNGILVREDAREWWWAWGLESVPRRGLGSWLLLEEVE